MRLMVTYLNGAHRFYDGVEKVEEINNTFVVTFLSGRTEEFDGRVKLTLAIYGRFDY